ncbi:hypothetical protein MKX01_031005 [Papaver californicum]|nr:hypothetical protein MKX01_031005 [Papaver californicum]
MGLENLRVYRNLLKAVKKHIGTEEFRNTSSLTDPSLIKHKINLASNYTFMLNSIHHHQLTSLLFSFPSVAQVLSSHSFFLYVSIPIHL